MKLTIPLVSGLLEGAQTTVTVVRQKGVNTHLPEAYLETARGEISDAALYEAAGQARRAEEALALAYQQIQNATKEVTSTVERKSQLWGLQRELQENLYRTHGQIDLVTKWLDPLRKHNVLGIQAVVFRNSAQAAELFADVYPLAEQMEQELTGQQWDVATHTWQHATTQLNQIGKLLPDLDSLAP